MKILRVIALAIIAMAASAHVSAQVATPLPLVVPGNPDARLPDVRVIIDISGSMKQNDPSNLRRPALELLVQLFPEASKAGVWTFGQWVNMLVAHKPVTDKWRKSALTQAHKISSVALHTNIGEALLTATADSERLDPRYKTSLILLTDGMVDVSKSPAENEKARQHIIDETIPRLRSAGITVHTVALSKNADRELMQRLAVETDGLAAVAETAEDLNRIFLQAFDAAVPAEHVPLEGNSFLIDSSIEEFTVLVFRRAGSKDVMLVSPDEKKYTRTTQDTDIRWFHQSDYELITVKRPYEGEWTIVADLEPNSRVTIVSNLSLLVTPLANNIFVDNVTNLSAVLKEQGENMVSPRLLKLVDMSVDITRREDGRSWTVSLSEIDPAPATGVFTSELEMLRKPGVYDITVNANGKTFQRQHRQTVQVREHFSTSVASSMDNPPQHEVTLLAVNPVIDTGNTRVTALINLPNGDTDMAVLTATAARTWLLPVKGVEQSGQITVSFKVDGQYLDGRKLNVMPEAVKIEHRVPGSRYIAHPVQAPEPEPEKTPEPEPKPEKAQTPEPATPAQTEAEPEQTGSSWKQIALYASIIIGNLLVFVLGYFVYKMVTSKPGTDILEDDDDVDDEDTTQAQTAASEPDPAGPEPETDELDELDTEPAASDDVDEVDIDMQDSDLDDVDITEDDDSELGDILDLPDDAIDIDPGTDEDEDKDK